MSCAFDVALEIVDLHVGKQCLQCGQIALKRVLAVDARLAHTEQVEVGAVDNLYLCIVFTLNIVKLLQR